MAPPLSNYLSQEVQDEVFSRNLQKNKEKNVNKRSLTVMAPSPFKLPFQEVQDAKIYKKRKEVSNFKILKSNLKYTYEKSK